MSSAHRMDRATFFGEVGALQRELDDDYESPVAAGYSLRLLSGGGDARFADSVHSLVVAVGVHAADFARACLLRGGADPLCVYRLLACTVDEPAAGQYALRFYNVPQDNTRALVVVERDVPADYAVTCAQLIASKLPAPARSVTVLTSAAWRLRRGERGDNADEGAGHGLYAIVHGEHGAALRCEPLKPPDLVAGLPAAVFNQATMGAAPSAAVRLYLSYYDAVDAAARAACARAFLPLAQTFGLERQAAERLLSLWYGEHSAGLNTQNYA